MRRDRLLRALRGERPDRTPIWLMRQAGRHLPGYRELRRRHGLLEIARDPELAVEVTLEPVRRYDVDAGIVFADITLPLAGLGVDFSIEPGLGPVVPHPIRSRADVDRLASFSARESVPYVGRAIERFLELEPERPILGFAGGPFTLAAYLIEGRPSRDWPETKRLMFTEPATFDRLIARLTEMTSAYLEFQAERGAAALQLFDTWLGILGPREFDRHLAGPLQDLFGALRSTGRPTIHFSVGSFHLFDRVARAGPDALSVDWRVPLGEVRKRVGPNVALQGNLDPALLLASSEALREGARSVLKEVPDGRGHVFNLGHGVLPATDPEHVRALVEFVHDPDASPSAGDRWPTSTAQE